MAVDVGLSSSFRFSPWHASSRASSHASANSSESSPPRAPRPTAAPHWSASCSSQPAAAAAATLLLRLLWLLLLAPPSRAVSAPAALRGGGPRGLPGQHGREVAHRERLEVGHLDDGRGVSGAPVRVRHEPRRSRHEQRAHVGKYMNEHYFLGEGKRRREKDGKKRKRCSRRRAN